MEPNSTTAPKTVAQMLEEAKATRPDIFIPTKEWVNTERPLSPSSLKAFRKCPMNYIEYLIKPYDPSPAMILGSATDCMVLQPGRFEKEFEIMPTFDKRTKVGKEAYAEFFNNRKKGITYIDEQTYDKALNCAKSVYRNADAMYYIERLQKTQVKLNWKDPATGLNNTGYVDGASHPELEDAFILEFKTTRDASQYGFIKEAANLDYLMQPGGYTLGYKHSWYEFPDVVFISVETTAPYGVNVHRCDGKYIEMAQKEYLNTLLAFNWCLEHNEWHKTYDFFRFKAAEDIHTYHRMEIPAWVKPKF